MCSNDEPCLCINQCCMHVCFDVNARTFSLKLPGNSSVLSPSKKRKRCHSSSGKGLLMSLTCISVYRQRLYSFVPSMGFSITPPTHSHTLTLHYPHHHITPPTPSHYTSTPLHYTSTPSHYTTHTITLHIHTLTLHHTPRHPYPSHCTIHTITLHHPPSHYTITLHHHTAPSHCTIHTITLHHPHHHTAHPHHHTTPSTPSHCTSTPSHYTCIHTLTLHHPMHPHILHCSCPQ